VREAQRDQRYRKLFHAAWRKLDSRNTLIPNDIAETALA
jgi:hypothetical protein